jgi:hypothetical protein
MLLYILLELGLNNLCRVIIKHVIIQKSRDAIIIITAVPVTTEVCTAAILAILDYLKVSKRYDGAIAFIS